MQLRRYGDSSTPYRFFELVVDQDYLDSNQGMLVTLPYTYIPGMNMLDVYYNGQFTASGGGYEEIDESHILMDIRNPDGSKKTQFDLGDEIHVRIWRQPPVFNSVQDEVRKLAYILGEGNYEIAYDYDPSGEYIIKETISGDYNVVKEYTYNELGKPLTETIRYGNRVITHSFVYDPVTYNLLRVTVRTQIN